ncbi:MAG: tryptophan--tRNA ligase [Candidatus Aminicenantia bacterium]
MKEIVLSGMRPSGPLHLGHWVGALSNWVKLQEIYECYYEIATWHALTTEYENPKEMNQWIKEMIVDWISVGLDPQKCVMFNQSDVKEHAELHLILSMLIPVPWLERVPTYKEQQREITNRDLSTYGFLGYPVLQTADIIIYKANFVPVGEDQVPHVELAREIVRRFNNFYGEVFPEPQAYLTPVPRLPGTDGRKMSKSYGNAVLLKDSEEEVERKILPMVTDTKRKRRTDPGEPEDCPVYDYHKVFSQEEERAEIEKGCRSAGIGCIDCKKILLKNLKIFMDPIRERRGKILKTPDLIEEILRNGAKKARNIAASTMEEVYRKIGIL